MWPKDNRESWEKIHIFVNEYPDNETWKNWKEMAREIISALEKLDLSQHFRIGQSMHHIIFSTLGHHRLSDEPRVTLEISTKQDRVRVVYSCSNLWLDEDASKNTVPFKEVIPILCAALLQLWQATMPSHPVPAGLTGA